MKKFVCMILVAMVIVSGMMAVAQGECEDASMNAWGLYTEKAVGEWWHLNDGEIIESRDLGDLMVDNLADNQKIHWRWMSMSSWIELEVGNPFIQLDSYKHSESWDAFEVQIMDEAGVYHELGKYPVRFTEEGDFFMDDDACFFASFGNGTVGISVSYEYDIEIRTVSNISLVKLVNVPAGNITVDNIEQGDMIVIIGKDGNKKSLPMVYVVGEGDFALVD